ncbi:hypothetical protein [Synechococcus phage Yong-L1-251]|nr:hypothetical protein [Synechococcus phage Yong-L1-251]
MSVRSLGSLTLDMVLKTGNFLGPMDKAGRSTKRQTKQMSDDFKKVSTAVTAVAAASAAGATALLAFTDMAARNARELRNQAQVANATVEEFQRMAYGVREFGIEEDKLSDILKDVNDRIGDFIATGGGPMADFFENIAPKVGLTADAFRNLSGPQALQLFYDSLEKANLSQEDMTFYLEAMASDTTALIPLLRNGGERLSEMADEADRLGMVMSAVEVAQLSQVAIELDKARAMVGGVGNAVALELAPFVLALAEDFGAAVESVGDLQAIVEQMVDTSVLYLGTFLDAVWEIDRDIQVAGVSTRELALVVARSMASATTAIIEGPVNALNFLIEKMNNVPGIDIDFADQPDFAYAMRDQVEVLEGALRSARIELDELTAGTAPSERLNEFIQQARAAADAITVDTPTTPGRGSGGTSKGEQEENEKRAKAAAKATEAINQQVKALEQQAAMLGMADDAAKLFELTQEGATDTQLAAARAALETISAYEASEEAAEDYKSLLEDLRTTEEKLTDQLSERLAVLDAVNVASDEYAETATRIAEAAFIDAPEFGGLDATIGGAFGELNKIDEAEEKLQEWYTTQLEMLEDFRAERADLSAQWDEQERALHEQHQNELARIEHARQIAQLAAAESTFGDLAGLARGFAGEQSSIYRALFATEKAFAIGKALMAVPSSFSKAYEAVIGIPVVGPVLAPVAGAAAAAAQVAQASSIQSIGMAHDGIDSIPETGTWLLEKGERVTTAETSAKLDATLDNTNAKIDAALRNSEGRMNRPGDNGGGNVTINQIEDKRRAGQVQERTGPDGERVIDMWVASLMGDGKVYKAMTNKFPLSTRPT